MVRLIIAVVVGFTSVAADGVCQDAGGPGSCLPLNNKGACCNLPLSIVGPCAASCCALFANAQGVIPDCPNFNDPNKVDCECAVDETDVPTAEPTPAPAPICQDERDSCSIVTKNQVCRPVRGPIIQALRCAASSCTFLAREAGFGPECPNFYNPADPNVPQLYIQTGPAAGTNCLCAAEETDGPTAEPTPAPTPCRP